MSTLWILTANSSFAKIYEVKGRGREIKELQHIDNPDGRKKSGEILNDRPGRAFDSMGGGRHALGTQVDVKEHQKQIFAQQLVKLLQEGLEKKSFEELAIVAPAHFLGEIKRIVSDTLKKRIVKEVAKDLNERISEQDRIAQLCGYLDLWNHS